MFLMGSSATKYKSSLVVQSIRSNRNDDINGKWTEDERTYVPKIGLERALSVISSLTKDSTSGQTHGLRHYNNQGNVIEKNLLKAEEHRKISKGFGITSRNSLNQWFVLYDDSRKPIAGSDDMLGTVCYKKSTIILPWGLYCFQKLIFKHFYTISLQ